MIITIILAMIAYALGSVSSAILICRYMGLEDPRTQGSGNPGATNVLRFADKKIAGLVLLCDILKGLLPVILVRFIGMSDFTIAFVGLAVVLGHIFPLFYDFKGGKGVATGFGVFLGLSWLLGLLAVMVWGIVAWLYRYSSLAATTAILAMPPASLLISPHYFFPVLGITSLIFYKHQDNLRRLREGVEPKIGEEK